MGNESDFFDGGMPRTSQYYYNKMHIWIINPYGNLPGEVWSPYRSTLLAEILVKNGRQVIWRVFNFGHRPKKFRIGTENERTISEGFKLRPMPPPAWMLPINPPKFLYLPYWACYHCGFKF